MKDPIYTTSPFFPTSLSSKNPQLQVSSRHKHKRGDDERELVRHIAAVVSDELAQRPRVPRLDHAHAPSDDAEAEGGDGGQAEREAGGVVPAVEVVVGEVALAEDGVLEEEDDKVAGAPVAEQAQEVGQVRVQLLAAAESEAQDGGETDERPDEPGHTGEWAGELLTGYRGAVDADYVCVDAR